MTQRNHTNRSRRSRGQAIVLVTLGLLAMCGLMGLAVDFGWSMFVEKQAQAAADTAALAAVEEAMYRLSVTNNFSCSGGTAVSCAPTPVTCSSLSSDATNNLWNGCLYAVKNGFTDGNTGPVQSVTVEANDGGNLPPIAPGVNDVAYWVTVRTTQQIPQLFSSVLGNTQGVVATSGTAAIVATVVPSSFYALNREGDCTSISGPNSYSSGFDQFCGVDVNIGGGAGQPAGICAGGTTAASICAANGIVLSSTCHGDGNQTGCSDSSGNGNGNGKGGGGGNGNWAGQTGNGNGGINVWALTSMIRSEGANTGAVNNPDNWEPTPVATTNPLAFQDPYRGVPDPPLAVPSSGALPKCGIPSGTINNTTGTQLVLGPYQYYATDNLGNPTGAPIRLSGNISFDNGGGCSTGSGIPAIFTSGASSVSGQFPAYLFYGGLDTGTQTHFGPGQYISVGVKNPQNPALLIGGGNRTHYGRHHHRHAVHYHQLSQPIPGQPDRPQRRDRGRHHADGGRQHAVLRVDRAERGPVDQPAVVRNQQEPAPGRRQQPGPVRQ